MLVEWTKEYYSVGLCTDWMKIAETADKNVQCDLKWPLAYNQNYIIIIKIIPDLNFNYFTCVLGLYCLNKIIA